MVSTPSSAPAESASDWALLEQIPSSEWGDAHKRLFISYVAREKAIRNYGAVRRACGKFNVDESTYYNWTRKFQNSNGHADEVSANVIARSSPTPTETIATPEPTNATTTIASDQAIVRDGIEQLMEQADQLAMRLEKEDHPLAAALSYQVLATRCLLDQLKREGVHIEATNEPSQTVTVAQELSLLLNAPPVETETPAPEIIAAAQEQPITPAIVREATMPEAEPLPTTPTAIPPASIETHTPRLSREDTFIAAINASLGISVHTYDRALTLAIEHYMHRFDTHSELATWTDRDAYEQNLRTWLATFDPNCNGSLRNFIVQKERERSRTPQPETATRPNEYSPSQRHFYFRSRYLRHAFALADQIHRSQECPADVPDQRLKDAAFQTFKVLSRMYTGDTNVFWQWAEPIIEKAIRADLGLCEPPSLEGKTLATPREQVPLIDTAIRNTLKKFHNQKKRPNQEKYSTALVEWINSIAQGGTVHSFMEAAELIIRQFKSEIETLADDICTRSNGRYKIGPVMHSLADSVMHSIRNFNPHDGRASLADFIQTGLSFTVKRKYTE